jgi:hypothetical protein
MLDYMHKFSLYNLIPLDPRTCFFIESAIYCSLFFIVYIFKWLSKKHKEKPVETSIYNTDIHNKLFIQYNLKLWLASVRVVISLTSI